MGRAFDSVPDRVTAYTVNIAGSLVGIVAMAALSYLQTPPEVWFAIVAGALPVFRAATDDRGRSAARSRRCSSSRCRRAPGRRRPIWSPYYKIQYEKDLRRISTNNIGHQQMVRHRS